MRNPSQGVEPEVNKALQRRRGTCFSIEVSQGHMRIAVINVNNLARVRRTLRSGWRIFIILTFLLVAFCWWGAFNGLPPFEQIAVDQGLQRQLLIWAFVLLSILAIVFFKKNGFARFTFAFITFFSLLTLLPFALLGTILLLPKLPWSDGLAMSFVGFGFLVAMIIFQDFLIAHCYVLFLSVIPLGRGKAFRHQVNSSLLLWSGQWKTYYNREDDKTGERLRSIAGARLRLMLGGAWFMFGAGCFLLAIYGVLNLNFLPALFDLEFAKAWHMVRHFQNTLPSEHVTKDILSATNSLMVMVVGFVCFFFYGFFWSQWQRENTLVFRSSLSQHMTSSDVLLLRTFKDDLKSVNREQSAWAGLFRIYMWLFTLEQLITNRLRYLGKVRLLDVDPKTEELVKKRWIKRLIAPQVVMRFVTAIFPALVIKFPPKGGIRYYIDITKDPLIWQPDIAQAMRIARMVVVILGTSTDSLAWEMEQIQKSWLLEKTIFVMPPGLRKKHYRARWQQFTKYLADNGTYNLEPLKKVKPQRVLAVCVHDDTMLVITGKRGNQLFYEAAIDIATIFTITAPAHRNRIIHKYLN